MLCLISNAFPLQKMTSSYSKYINTPAPHAICVPHPRQTIPLHLNLTPREYRSYTAGFSPASSHGRAPDPPRGENPSSCSRCSGCHGRCPARWSHRTILPHSAVLFEAPSHPAAASPRAHRPPPQLIPL